MRISGRFIPCARPERPKYGSPGQRPGFPVRRRVVALKGRNNCRNGNDRFHLHCPFRANVDFWIANPYCRPSGGNDFGRQSRRRTGTTLIELLVVITVGAVMLGLGMTTIHLLLGAEHEASRSVRYAASVARLAQVFREDVHSAQAVELMAVEPGTAEVLVIGAGEDRQIRYELEAHRATRIEAAQDRPSHLDVFYFPPRSRLSFAREMSERLVRLEIEMAAYGPAHAASLPSRRLAIEAAPARLRRFEVHRDEGAPTPAADDGRDQETGKGADP